MPPSVKDVAVRAGFSVGTVSNVLNRPELVSEESRERVLKAIEELGYVRNDAARQLRAGQSRCVGMVVLDAANPFFADVVQGAEAAAAEHGVSVLLGNSAHDPAREDGYLELFEELRVRGVLVSPVGNSSARLDRMKRRGAHAVVVDRAQHDRGFSSVSVDDHLGGRLAVDHLLSLGYRRIAFVGGPPSLVQVVDRLAGARTAAGRAGVEIEWINTEALTLAAGRVVAEQIVARPAARRPEAVFAANDLVALGLLQGLTASRELSVPDDIALIGYDDIDFAAGAAVPLSSVSQPRFEIGYRAMQMLLFEAASEAPAAPVHVVLEPELVVRASTAQV